MRIVLLGIVCIILVGAFFLVLPITHKDGEWFSVSDALFTATSCVCSTGLAVASTVDEFNIFGQIVLLLLIQIGGLGFMTGATLIFMILGKRITLQQRLLLKESFNQYKLQGVVGLIKKILIYTAVIEAVGAFLLMIPFIPKYGFWSGVFKSVFLSVSAFCNAGFDVIGPQSLTPFVGNVLVILPIALLIVIGGLGYTVLLEIGGLKRAKKMSLHVKMVLITTAILIAASSVMFIVFEWNYAYKDLSAGDKILAGIFQAVTPRTAGFASVDQLKLSDTSMVLTEVLMFIGASPASTGGGIKTTTFVVILLSVTGALRAKRNINVSKECITETMVRKSLTIITIGIGVVVSSILLVTLFERNNVNAIVTADNIVFECISAFSTAGLTRGITPFLTAGSKFVLGLAMFVGRLGPLTVGVALVSTNHKEDKITYPDAKLLVG